MRGRRTSVVFRAYVLVIACQIAVQAVSLAAEIKDEFDAGNLDTCIWNTLQADHPRLITFGEENHGKAIRRYLTNSMDEKRGNERRDPEPCIRADLTVATADEDELEVEQVADDLGPSLIFPLPAGIMSVEPKCPPPSNKPIQRNELRFKKCQSEPTSNR